MIGMASGISAAQFRRIALALEGATEAPHVDRAAFKVARIFATLAADGRTANLKLTPDEQELKCLLAPDLYAPVPNAWGRQGWTTLDLRRAGVADVEAALGTAWQHALPRTGKGKGRSKVARKGSGEAASEAGGRQRNTAVRGARPGRAGRTRT